MPGCAIRRGAKPVSANVRAAPDRRHVRPRRRAAGRDEHGERGREPGPFAGRITTAAPSSPQACFAADRAERPPLHVLANAAGGPARRRCSPSALFLQAFLRLRRRRPGHAPWTRALLFAAGLALLVLPLVSPLDEAGDERLLSAHMLQHVLIGDAAAVLLVLAVRGPLLFFLLPPALLRPLAGFRPLRVSPLDAAAPARHPRPLGGRDPRLARSAPLRLRGRAPVRSRPRAPELRRDGAARVDAARRPGSPRARSAAPAADPLRARDAGSRPAGRGRAPLQLERALRELCAAPPTGSSASRRSPTSALQER